MTFIQFAEEVNKLKHLKRTGWVESGIKNPETVAEHTYRTALLVMFLAPDELDKDRMIKMALVHELGEIDVGDITPFDNLSRDKKHNLEKNAIIKLSNLIDSRKDELIGLWEEYEKQETEEARFVRQLDILEMMFQAAEYEKNQGDNIEKSKWTFWEYADKKITDPRILKIYNELKEQRK